MTRPKKGTKAGDLATKKWRETMLKKFGSEEAVHAHMQEMGRIGGKLSTTGGFYGHPERAKIAGAKGGKKSRRGPATIDANGNKLKKDGTPFPKWSEQNRPTRSRIRSEEVPEIKIEPWLREKDDEEFKIKKSFFSKFFRR